MSRASVLARGQAAAEAGMVDACTIRRIIDTTVDDFSGADVHTYADPDPYSGKCRVQQALALAQREDVGQDDTLLLRLEVQLPVDGTEGLEVGDEVAITASAHDPDLVGRVFLIRDLFHKTHPTSRRIQCTERTS